MTFKFVSDDKFMQSIEEEDITKEKAKNFSSRNPSQLYKEPKVKYHVKEKRRTLHPPRSLLVKQPP